MSSRFQELDWRRTPMGDLSLRRRLDPASGVEVHEVKLGEEFLMSSLFTVAEAELARRALAAIGSSTGGGLRVAVGGLGLGYTAAAVLEDERVATLVVVEALAPVIRWHEEGLVPLGRDLTADPRCRLLEGDFFALVTAGRLAVDGEPADARFDAILVDIDHSPRHLLHPSHATFYEPDGVRRLARLLRPGGVYALWSDDPPDPEYLQVVRDGLGPVRADVVPFDNPLTGGTSTNTVYVATAPEAGPPPVTTRPA